MTIDTKLERHLRHRLEGGKKLVIPYITAGLPSPQRFVKLVADMATRVDALEVGIPFSDPIMDGPIIQEASARALEAGVTASGSIHLIKEALRHASIPIIVMTYFNPVDRMGLAKFVAAVADAGVEGVIVPDLPLEESSELAGLLARKGIAYVQLVAPMTSTERARKLAKSSSGFVYAVSRLGVTGEREELATSAADVVGRVRPHTDLPILLGIGITNSEQAAEAATVADGVIVGSAIMKRVLAQDLAGAAALAAEIAKALR